MAGERGANGGARSLHVAHLADHDYIRILAQNGAQTMNEIEPDRRLDLHLVDALELVFDRVLDREYLAFDRVQDLQRGVEGRRLAAAGRAADEDDAVGQGKQSVEDVGGAIVEAERCEREIDLLLVEDAHDDALAVHDRAGRNSQIDLTAGNRDLDAAIL